MQVNFCVEQKSMQIIVSVISTFQHSLVVWLLSWSEGYLHFTTRKRFQNTYSHDE